MSKSCKGYGNHFLVAGVAALVASSIVALGSLSRAEVTAEQRASCEASCRGDTSPDMPPPEQRDCATWCEDGDYRGGPAPSGDAAPAPMQCPPNPNPPEVPAKCGSETGYQWQTDPNWHPSQPAPSSQTSPQWGADRCSQIHSAQWGDRCAKEQALLQSGCVQGISPECGGQSPQQGQQQGMGKTIEIKNDIATCYADDGRWTQDQECQRAAQERGLIRGQQRNVPQQQWDDGGRMGGFQKKCDSANPPKKEGCRGYWFCPESGEWQCRQDGGQPGRGPGDYGRPAAGSQGFPGGPMMGPGGFGQGMGPGMMGGPGMGGMMGPGGPGRLGPMSCDMFDDIIDEMKSRLTEMDEEKTERLSDMEENMRGKAADQIERLQDKIDGTDDEKKIAKYEKQITKINGKIEKQLAKMKERMEKQFAKMKARMEKEIAKLEDKAADCEDNEGEGGDFGGGEFQGGGGFNGSGGPSFGPGGGNMGPNFGPGGGGFPFGF